MNLLTSDNISNWYILNDKDNPNYNYIIDSISNTSKQSLSSKKFINGVAAPITMSTEGVTHSTALGGAFIIQKNSNTKFKDVFDLLIEDFSLLRNKLTYPYDYSVKTKNLLKSATITINDNPNIQLTYNSKYNQIFNVNYATQFFKELDNELLGRLASKYDFRFYNDDTSYKIKSGKITITVNYDEVFLINTSTVEPFYSPQSFEIVFDLDLVGNINDYENFNINNSNINYHYPDFNVNLNNLTLVCGQRYLKLGQASLIESSKLDLNGKLIDISLQFKSFARMER